MNDHHSSQGAPAAGNTLALTPLDDLHTRVTRHLDATARAWFDRALDEAAARAGTHGPLCVWELRRAEAGRQGVLMRIFDLEEFQA